MNINRKYTLALAALTLCGTLQAQDVYKAEALSGTDLAGTSRFVGMGGAMSALGADMSVISQNPAGIGLYRRSDIALTFGVTSQPNGEKMADINKARASFDQAGFVYSIDFSRSSSSCQFLNFAFNYQKRRNFKNFIGLDNIATQGGMSQSWQMMDLAYLGGQPLDLSTDQGAGKTTPLTVCGYDTQMIVPTTDANGNITGYEPSHAQSYNYRRAQWGSIDQYDLNLSTNFNDRFYAGLTMGIYNVNFNGRTDYGETLVDAQGATAPYYLSQSEQISGAGFDVKLGFIVRPVVDSNLRLGLSVSTPIFYDLSQTSYLIMQSPYSYTDAQGVQYQNTVQDVNTSVDYRFNSPWRLNLSLGTTIGRNVALGAEYELANYKSAQFRNPDGYFSGYYDYYVSSSRDRELDKEIDACMNAVHTFRAGMEFKVLPEVSLRLGYNYVSKPLKDDAFLNLFTNSPSYMTSTNTDYVNLGATNRITGGVGYRGKHFYGDLSCQYQMQKGTVYAFHAPEADGITNRLQGQEVDLNRTNLMLTLGYRF